MHIFIQNLPAHLFWDTDPASIDPEEDDFYIMQRVLDRGNMNNAKDLYEYYGLDRIKKSVVQISNLQTRTAKFLSLIHSIPYDEFLCVKLKKEGNYYL